MFHLCKHSRLYTNDPYMGPSSDYKRAECETLDQAIEMQKVLTRRNPVGWEIYDSTTGKLIKGVFFEKNNETA